MKYILLIASAAFLSSCSTTGDPRSGGIFWSPQKAQSRVNQLDQIHQEAQYQKQKVESKNRKLKTTKTKELNTY